jgi:aminoglycoside phosphotransferase (APT) family kinase protein
MGNLYSTFNDMQLKRNLESAASACPANDNGDVPTGMIDALEKMGLLARGDRPTVTPLDHGGSSEIYRVKLGWGTVCIKRSLPRLKFPADATLPVQRSNFESEWLRLARDVLGEAVPAVLAEQHGMFAMEYLDPARHKSWATQLHGGDVNPSTAAEVGRMIGRVHAATANNFAVAQRFSTDRMFHAARIEPLLLATTGVQPAAEARLKQLASSTGRTKLALIHGDFSPENILIGPKGPVLLDAEYAWYGDPAFDLALCLSHLLVACVLFPQWCTHYLTCYTACCAAYAQRVTWEMPEQTDERAALLLPALTLAHACGRMPSGVLQRDSDKERAAVLAGNLLLDPVLRLGAVREAWRRGMADR